MEAPVRMTAGTPVRIRRDVVTGVAVEVARVVAALRACLRRRIDESGRRVVRLDAPLGSAAALDISVAVSTGPRLVAPLAKCTLAERAREGLTRVCIGTQRGRHVEQPFARFMGTPAAVVWWNPLFLLVGSAVAEWAVALVLV